MTEIGNVGIQGIVEKKTLLPQGRGYLLTKSLLHHSFCSFPINMDTEIYT